MRHQLKGDRKREQEHFRRTKKQYTYKTGWRQNDVGICAAITDCLFFICAKKQFLTVNSQPMTEASLFLYHARRTSSCTICYQCFIVASGIIQQQSHCHSGKLVINDASIKNKSLTDFPMSSQ